MIVADGSRSAKLNAFSAQSFGQAAVPTQAA
jgi:hypothetical protein